MNGGVALRTRGYRPDDAAAVADLLRLAERHAGGPGGTTDDDVRTWVSVMVPEPRVDTRLGFASDGTLVAVGLNLGPASGGARIDALGAVRPDWRGRGVGRELLAWQLNRAARVHREAGAGVPWHLMASTVAGDLATERLYRRLGLRPARHWVKMVATTTAAGSRPALPAGLRATTYSPAYERDLHAVHLATFADLWRYQPQDLDTWARMTVRSARFAPELSEVVFDGTGIVGYLLSYHDAEPTRLHLGQSGVLRRWRGHGLCGTLVARALAAAAEAGKRTAGLVTDAANPTGAVTVARRAGFTVEYRRVTYSLTMAATGRPPD